MRRLTAIILASCLAGCGSSGTTTAPTAQPSVAPATAVSALTAVAAGTLIVHPSADNRWFVALETPILITESAGGAADWDFARMVLLSGGTEVDRFELSATSFAQAGTPSVNPRSSLVWNLIFRFVISDFTTATITLGFVDKVDGHKFTIDVPFSSFNGVTSSIQPIIRNTQPLDEPAAAGR